MKLELFFIQPEPGSVVEIYTLHRYHYFLTGYCRSVIKTAHHLHFIGGFTRESDAGLLNNWAVPCEWSCVPVKRASIGVTLEQPWMRELNPPGRRGQKS